MRKLIKKWFKLFDEQDFDNAVANVGNASDRVEYEWKLKRNLFAWKYK